MTIILFLIVLAILIFVHELGHFIVARSCGIKVTEFALGFGPSIFSKKVGEVTYSLKCIPFGGYVKIFGEDPNDDSISGPDRDRSFVHKPKWQQVATLFAGIFFNLVFACFLFFIGFNIGVPASTGSFPEYRSYMQDEHVAVTLVNPDSPAEKAGLRTGDTLLYETTAEIQKIINDSGTNGVDIEYLRNGEKGNARIIAEQGIVPGKYAIGIAMDDVGTLKLPIERAALESVRYTLHIIVATIIGIYSLIAGIFDGSSSLSAVTGPIGIAGLVGDAAHLGFSYLLMFTALISINLGVLNLVPFPALDGGRILFVIIEAIIRRPIKPVIANTMNALGFGLLIILMLVVTYKDIAHLVVR